MRRRHLRDELRAGHRHPAHPPQRQVEEHAHLHQASRKPNKRAPKGAKLPVRFAIAHFAGTVEYDSAGFVFKNSDALHVELPMMLAARSDHAPHATQQIEPARGVFAPCHTHTTPRLL